MLALTSTPDHTAELRGWLALIWAVLIGSATFVGVFVAVRNYLHSTWQTKVAAARLVWVEKTGPNFAPKAGSGRYTGGRRLPISYTKTAGYISAPDLFEAGEVDNRVTPVWKVDGYRLFAEITNNSKEPMGNVDLVLRKGDHILAKKDQPSDRPRTLGPESKILIEVLIPQEGNRAFRPGRFMLTFTDSSGNRWERLDTRPPKLVPKSKARRFQRLRARMPRAS